MPKPYHQGRVHVQAEQCATCVGRPGNLMQLTPGRLAALVRDNVRADAALTCHATLYRQAEQEAVCRWFFDHHPTLPLRLAVALDVVTFVPTTDGRTPHHGP